MKISSLKMDYGYNGKAIAECWVTLHTSQEVDVMLEWLRHVKVNMARWEKLNAPVAQDK